MIFFENNRFKYYVSWPMRRHKVTSSATRQTRVASPAQVDKLGKIFAASQDMPWPSPADKYKAEQCIYIAFCLAVHDVGDFNELILTQDPAVLALLFGTIDAASP